MSIAGLAVLCLASQLSATTWTPPKPTVVVSQDAYLLVRIEPGSNRVQSPPYVAPFSVGNAQAIYFHYDEESGSYKQYQSVTLANGSAPADSILKDNGVLVTIDSWGPSTGPAVAIYSPIGELVAAHTLSDLYSEEVVEALRWNSAAGAVSWRKSELRLRFRHDSVLVFDRFGNVFDFDINDGSFDYRGDNPQVLGQ